MEQDPFVISTVEIQGQKLVVPVPNNFPNYKARNKKKGWRKKDESTGHHERSSGWGSHNIWASGSSDQTFPLRQKIINVDNLFIANYN